MPDPLTALEDEADPTYSHFAHRAECLELLDEFVRVDVGCRASRVENERELALVRSIGDILDYYLPLPGLLDPSLDAIIPPLMDKLAGVVAVICSGGTVDQTRLNRLGEVINWVIKVRGWKTHFPSGIHHLAQLVELLSPPTGPSSSLTPTTSQHPLIASPESWQTRSVLLLWLALLLTVPFSLSAFSNTPASATLYNLDPVAAARLASPALAPLAQRAVMLSLPLLHRPGKEGAYAALVLARVYCRPDAVAALPAFFTWVAGELEEGDKDSEANLVASLLEMLALLPGMLPPGHLHVLKAFTEDRLLPHLRGSRTAAGSSLVRKLAVKARGRWWVSRLTRATGKDAGEGLDEWLADGLEMESDDLLSGLSDKDTIVRYSSAKYLARLAFALPSDFAEQLVSATIDLFAGTEEEPVLYTTAGTVLDPGGNAFGGAGTMGFGGSETSRGEARWHGTCLAIAELARRGLVRDEAIGVAIPWVLKALTFDIRRATHSIGSNVRDAAAYVLWSLSRACPADVIRPFAEDMATSLISVACLDREVGVRRAASAAYQEGVGRLVCAYHLSRTIHPMEGLYPEGIDVLAKTDFYSVSVRRIAFTTAVPAVAVHTVYRRKLREYLHGVTLRHWDEAIRTAGAGALRDILQLGDEGEMDDAVTREIAQIPSLDANNVHGALSALAAIAPSLLPADPRRRQIYLALGTVRPAALVSPQSACILVSACNLICASINQHILHGHVSDGSAVTTSQTNGGSSTEGYGEQVQKILTQYIETTMRRREEECHEAVKEVFASVSALKDEEAAGAMVDKLILDIKSIRAAQRQSAALCLGSIRYDRCASHIEKAVGVLLAQLAVGTKADVETRRYAIRSLASNAVQPIDLRPTMHRQIISAFITALSDYSTDQRGDVGSWIRVAALRALRETISALCRCDVYEPDAPVNGIKQVVPQDLFEDVISGMARLGVEKLEPVRAAAAFAWTGLREGGAGRIWIWEGEGAFGLEGLERLEEASYEEIFRHSDQRAWFASAMPLLWTPYRKAVMQGLTLTMGSQVESIAMLAFTPFLAAITDPRRVVPNEVDRAIVRDVLDGLAKYMAKELGSNRVFVPALQTAWRLAVALRDDPSTARQELDDIWARIVNLSCRGVPTIKSIDRLSGTVKLLVALVTASAYPSAQAAVIKHLPSVLSHRFPRVRAMCAEQLYLALSEAVEDEVDSDLEEALLETEWTGDEASEKAGEVVRMIATQLGISA